MALRKTPVGRRRKEHGLDFFRRVSLLSDLDDEGIREVFKISRFLPVRKGEVIMREGEPGETMYLFVQGKVEVINTLTMKIGRGGFEAAEKSLVTLDASMVGFFGEMAILEDEPRSATVTASTDCDLYEINKKDLLALGERRPDIGYRIILRIAEVLCSRLRKSNRDILKLTTALSISLSRGGQR